MLLYVTATLALRLQVNTSTYIETRLSENWVKPKSNDTRRDKTWRDSEFLIG